MQWNPLKGQDWEVLLFLFFKNLLHAEFVQSKAVITHSQE